jgi:hypothetical protein
MLALAAAAHGQDPSEFLIILGAFVAAVFWRILLKIAVALAILLFAILVIHVVHGETTLLQHLRNVVG